MSQKDIIFEDIKTNLCSYFRSYNLENLKTNKGNTQFIERNYIKIIKDLLISKNYKFIEAGSQQPYDFRITLDNDEIMLLEIKKTDSMTVYFNDTCPTNDVYYIILHTGKKFKTKEDIKPCIFGVKGEEFIEIDKDWLDEYKEELKKLKMKFKGLGEIIDVYPRPTFKAKIKFLFDKYYENSIIEYNQPT